MSRPWSRVRSFFARHPVALLMVLTPGIPEYISGSSAFSSLILNPVMFAFQLAANLGLYGSGVLLIYEAKVRWGKGWGTVLLLGGAYGILEEGVALSTLFDPGAGPVGTLGTYGHWSGVNWIWAGSIVPFHAVFSIALPIALIGAALPSTVGRSLISKRQVAVVVAMLCADVGSLMLVVNRADGFWMGWPVFVGSVAVIGALVLVGRRLPAQALEFRGGVAGSRRAVFAAGVAFFPAVILTQALGQGAHIPAAADLAAELLVQGAFLLYFTGRAALRGGGRSLVAMAAGLVTPIGVIGGLSEASFPLILVVDVTFALFFVELWNGQASHEKTDKP